MKAIKVNLKKMLVPDRLHLKFSKVTPKLSLVQAKELTITNLKEINKTIRYHKYVNSRSMIACTCTIMYLRFY